MSNSEEDTIYTVVINNEEQYSIWPIFKDIPSGWNKVGKEGLKLECLTYIKEVWKDMRPLSLRKWMEENKDNLAEDRERLKKEVENVKLSKKTISPTVTYLSNGLHPISTRPLYKTVKELKESLDDGFTHINFKDTQGETCLGVQIDIKKTNLNRADFSNNTGTIHIVGSLTLDYIRVECVADISLSTLEGEGFLNILDEAVAEF